MLLAGGQGSRLHALTSHVAKPAVPFGGKYRIIDFPLSNCINSGIDTVGVLTQYRPLELNAYIGNGEPWDLDRSYGGVHILPPYMREGEKGTWYKGTANAIYQNINFLETYDPETAHPLRRPRVQDGLCPDAPPPQGGGGGLHHRGAGGSHGGGPPLRHHERG